jgi:hypothetical protein
MLPALQVEAGLGAIERWMSKSHVPSSERDNRYLATLKQLVEVIFDTFVMSYVHQRNRCSNKA